MTNTNGKKPGSSLVATQNRTILAEVSGFTPLLDVLVDRYGIITAAVFGIIWRYCQMNHAACTASIDRLANDLGVNRRTIIRHIQTLLDDGLIRDLTPGLRNKPHQYEDTGKAGLVAKIEAQAPSFPIPTDAECQKVTAGVTLSHPHGDLESLDDSIKKQGNETGYPPPPDDPEPQEKILTPQQMMVGALAEVMGLDYNIPRTAARLGKFAKELLQAGYSPDLILRAYGEDGRYYQIHWKGKRKDKPDEGTITETIKSYASFYKPKPQEDEKSIFARLNRSTTQ